MTDSARSGPAPEAARGRLIHGLSAYVSNPRGSLLLAYLQNGVWDGERLLPQGWTDYALTATHTGTSYAACFRTNIDRLFPDLPPDTVWASGASDQRIFILRRHRLTVAVSNETDHPMDLLALNHVIAAAISAWA
jgi:hypothetical protein